MKQTNYNSSINEMRDFGYSPEFGLHAAGPPVHLNNSMNYSGQPFLYPDLNGTGSVMNLSNEMPTNHGLLGPNSSPMSLVNSINHSNGALLSPNDNYPASFLLPLERAMPLDSNRPTGTSDNGPGHGSIESGFLPPFFCSVPAGISPLLTNVSTSVGSLPPITNLTGNTLSHTSSASNNSHVGHGSSSVSLMHESQLNAGSRSSSGSNFSLSTNSLTMVKCTQAPNSVTCASSGNGSVRSSSSSSSCLSGYEYYQFLSNNSIANSSATSSNDSMMSSNEPSTGGSMPISSNGTESGSNEHEFHDLVKREKPSNHCERYACMFSESDIALATEPGDQVHFDPTACHFSDDELRPRPMLRKSRKQAVPDCQKDGKYWVRRAKNNIAAKKSREQRRLKENQVLLRASFLERQNQALRLELQLLRCENAKSSQFGSQN